MDTCFALHIFVSSDIIYVPMLIYFNLIVLCYISNLIFSFFKASDMMDAILENYPKTKKQFIVSILFPNEFFNCLV